MLNISLNGFRPDDGLVDKVRDGLSTKPPFLDHDPDIEKMIDDSSRFREYEKFILIGNGGSINNSFSMIETMGNLKPVAYVTTMEPDHLKDVAQKFPEHETLVIVVSKSGNTVGVLESMLFFMNRGYSLLVITNARKGALLEIVKKRDIPMIIHPDVGGRYSGRTSSAMVPAYLAGFDIAKFNKGCLDMYERCSSADGSNPALMVASWLFDLENKGKTDVFMPIYSSRLFAFSQLIVQLMHESFGKDNKGQTFFGGLAPETQHHTNQRFFGGRDNICGMFIAVDEQDNPDITVSVPDDLKSVSLRDGTLDVLDGLRYQKALEFELEGTYRDALDKGLPVIRISLDRITPYSVGEMMGFWQYVALYSSVMRNVNPYDQPQVESSKEISFQLRLSRS